MIGQNDEVKPEVGVCGPGCSCGSAGVGSRSKWMIGGGVVLIACLVAAARFSGAKEAVPQTRGIDQTVVATASAVQPATDAARYELRKGLSKPHVVATNTNKMQNAFQIEMLRRSLAMRSARARTGCGAGGCGPKGCGSKPPAGSDMGLPKEESTVRDTGLEATAK